LSINLKKNSGCAELNITPEDASGVNGVTPSILKVGSRGE